MKLACRDVASNRLAASLPVLPANANFSPLFVLGPVGDGGLRCFNLASFLASLSESLPPTRDRPVALVEPLFLRIGAEER